MRKLRAALVTTIGAIFTASIVATAGYAFAADATARVLFRPETPNVDFGFENGEHIAREAYILNHLSGTQLAEIRLDFTTLGTVGIESIRGDYAAEGGLVEFNFTCSPESVVRQNTTHRFCTSGPLPIGEFSTVRIDYSRDAQDTTIDSPIVVRFTAKDPAGSQITLNDGAPFIEHRQRCTYP